MAVKNAIHNVSSVETNLYSARLSLYYLGTLRQLSMLYIHDVGPAETSLC